MRPFTDVEHYGETVMEGNDAYLPDEIIVNILKRLPIKSLIRFQSVSKYWKNLLKDPWIIADHLHHSSHRPSLLLHQPHNGNKHLHLNSLDCDFQVHQVDKSPLIDYLSRFKSDLSRVRIVGSSNGLVCVYCRSSPHNLLVWNPAIKELREVPTMAIGLGFGIGFGFSSVANDYRIVILYVFEPLHWHYPMSVNKVKLYSLGTGLWKDVEFGILEGVHIYTEANTSGNGAIFWVGMKQNDNCLVIVSFDIATEVFTLIPMPDLRPRSTCIPTMFDNKLALLAYHDMGTLESGFIDLWVHIDEEISNTCELGGGRWSWTKKYSSSPYLYPYFLIPKSIWRDEIVCKVYVTGELIYGTGYDEAMMMMMMDDLGKFLYLLNPTNNGFKRLYINDFDFGVEILNYVESLVPVGKIRIEGP